MKKNLLLCIAVAISCTAGAQEYAAVDTTVLQGLGATTQKTKVAVPSGTQFAATDNVILTTAYADQYQFLSVDGPKVDNTSYNTFNVGNIKIKGNGLQGNTNPTRGGANSANTSVAPDAGAVFKFDVKKDGYLYILHKASSNKQYEVSEGNGTDASGYQTIGYQFAGSDAGNTALGTAYGYILNGGQLSGEDQNYGHLPVGYNIQWPEVYFTGDQASAIKTTGLSIIKFPVYATLSYLVNACGSKMTLLGFYFDTTGNATITISNGVSNDITLMEAGIPANAKTIDAISAYAGQLANIKNIVTTPAQTKDFIYNLAGQRVNKSYKGIVINNRKKYIQ